MMAARTRDLDDFTCEAVRRNITQFVFVGVGLDCRPFRLLGNQPDVTVYELDLPDMLERRETALDGCNKLPQVDRRAVPIDLEHHDVDTALCQAGFDKDQPALFIFEGASMYFTAPTNQRILRSIARCMSNSSSELWFDAVAERVVSHTSGFAEVEAFVRAMSRIGEPFVFGLDDASSFLREVGLETVRTTPAVAYARQQNNPVFSLYGFHRARRSPVEL